MVKDPASRSQSPSRPKPTCPVRASVSNWSSQFAMMGTASISIRKKLLYSSCSGLGASVGPEGLRFGGLGLLIV